MSNRVFVLPILVVLFLIGCTEPASNLVEAGTPPALPAYVTPTAVPTFAPPGLMQPGESVTLTDDKGRFIWIQYLGVKYGYQDWACTTNNPDSQFYTCYQEDVEIHSGTFFWELTTIPAWVSTGQYGTIILSPGWHVTTEKVLMP